MAPPPRSGRSWSGTRIRAALLVLAAVLLVSWFLVRPPAGEAGPSEAAHHRALGAASYQQGKFAEAARHFSVAVQLDPREPGQYLQLGLAHLALGRLSPAEESIRRAIQLSPTAPGQHFALSLVLERRGDISGATRALRRELDIDPRSADARMRLAEVESRPPAGK